MRAFVLWLAALLLSAPAWTVTRDPLAPMGCSGAVELLVKPEQLADTVAQAFVLRLPQFDFGVVDQRNDRGLGDLTIMATSIRRPIGHAGRIQAQIESLIAGRRRIYVSTVDVVGAHQGQGVSTMLFSLVAREVAGLSEWRAELAYDNFEALSARLREQGFVRDRRDGFRGWHKAGNAQSQDREAIETALFETPFGRVMRRLGARYADFERVDNSNEYAYVRFLYAPPGRAL